MTVELHEIKGLTKNIGNSQPKMLQLLEEFTEFFNEPNGLPPVRS